MAKLKPNPQLRTQLKNRDDWIRRVTSLANQVADWSSGEGWSVERHDKEITEKHLGTYTAPVIVIGLKGGQIIVTPIALHVSGGNGRVDLEALPTLARVKLIGEDGGWKLFADPNVPLGYEWSQETFVRLAHDLLS